MIQLATIEVTHAADGQKCLYRAMDIYSVKAREGGGSTITVGGAKIDVTDAESDLKTAMETLWSDLLAAITG